MKEREHTMNAVEIVKKAYPDAVGPIHIMETYDGGWNKVDRKLVLAATPIQMELFQRIGVTRVQLEITIRDGHDSRRADFSVDELLGNAA